MMKHSKRFLLAAIAAACLGMMMPTHVDARGGGGGGGRGGGGGGRGGGGGGGGWSGGRGFSGGNMMRSGPVGGSSNFRGPIGNSNVRSFTPASPGTRLNGNNWRRGDFNRWRGGFGWGWWIGPGYWGFGYPFWYGGYPFWYDTLAYGAYLNPYYTNAYDYGGYDYGAPIQQSQNPAPENENDFFAQARAAFYAGNYQEALRDIEHAAIDMPGNPDVHQFHSLVFFALGDYQKAAAVAHTVLDSGPGWNWSILQTFYPSPDVYTQQLRALEHSITERGDQAATRFLLGYEYMMLGHYNAAGRQFDRVVALEPRDTLAKNIMAGIGRAPGINPQPPSNPAGGQPGQTPSNVVGSNPAPPQPATPTNPVNPAGLTGSWKAMPAPNVTIEFTLQPDKHFTWKFSEGGQSQSFTGTYVQQGNELVLTRDQDNQKMNGVVSMKGNGFNFRLKDAESNDPGLEFSK